MRDNFGSLYFFVTLTLCVPARSFADFLSCATAAAHGTMACQSGALSAKAQADALSAQAKQPGQTGMNASAANEASVTSQIAAIYQSALSTCNNAASTCQSQCAGGDSMTTSLGASCAKDIAQYQTQLSPGQVQNVMGQAGASATWSDAVAKPGDKNKSVTTAAAATSTTLASPSSASPGATIKGGSNVASASDQTGMTYIGGGASEDLKRPSPSNALSGSDKAGDPLSKAEAVAALATASTPGSASAAAVANATAAANLLKKTTEFCADSGNNKCPSCGAPSSDQVDLNQACTASCMSDPGYGPQLGSACRSVVGEKMGASPGEESDSVHSRWISLQALRALGHRVAPSRAPASKGSASRSEISGPPNGLSLFEIQSHQILRMCHEFRLKCQ